MNKHTISEESIPQSHCLNTFADHGAVGGRVNEAVIRPVYMVSREALAPYWNVLVKIIDLLLMGVDAAGTTTKDDQ